MLLQQERLKEYGKGSREITLTLKYFRSHMKFKQMSNAKLLRELSTHLKALQSRQLIIDKFEDVNRKSGIHITFLPLTEKELIVYGYDMENALEDQHIIDTDYKEAP